MLLLALCLAIVLLFGLAAAILIQPQPARARIDAEGVQEIAVQVRGKFRPDRILVKRGIPVRMLFRREEDLQCSEHVIFSHSHLDVGLQAFGITPATFTPPECGDYLFTCAMGVYQGCLLVREPSPEDVQRVEAAHRQSVSPPKGVATSDD